MPIDYRIDHDRRLVIASARGVMTREDAFEYQREAWSRPDVVGYDELLDMSTVSGTELKSPEEMRDLAVLAASTDVPGRRTRLAIVVGKPLHYGLSRMYQAYRETAPSGMKEVGVFHSREEALQWLGRNVQTTAPEEDGPPNAPLSPS
ncbi:hypothetical protein JW916_11795 [Candidatus Sumerlaeota bacterium]|nr:hypothetical protein [Candidatus Sumerlaeota bacterium]